MIDKKYKVQFTNVFKKQYKKIKNNPNFKQEEFNIVIKHLTNNERLPEKYKNHLLNPKSNRNLGMPYTKRYIIRI